ncbi:uncharacterized protein IUM83_17866 [Phytophthora cinnamomi]|uniref:uncharacterized protein n=1 Tax=Phytophthora cinnamomi TaxID=4785 RepID=UPI003559BD35|nr:hypothetical protein IUM83_17866 [Phytophthora cinnamomi]
MIPRPTPVFYYVRPAGHVAALAWSRARTWEVAMLSKLDSKFPRATQVDAQHGGTSCTSVRRSVEPRRTNASMAAIMALSVHIVRLETA